MNRDEKKRLIEEMTKMGLTDREQEAALAIISVLKPMPAHKRLSVIKRIQARLAEDKAKQKESDG